MTRFQLGQMSQIEWGALNCELAFFQDVPKLNVPYWDLIGTGL